MIYEARQKGWSVRYTNPGEPDVYGGVLELLATGPMTGFNSGQLVRVLRAEYLVDAVGFNRVSGMPLASQDILEAINQILEEKK